MAERERGEERVREVGEKAETAALQAAEEYAFRLKEARLAAERQVSGAPLSRSYHYQ